MAQERAEPAANLELFRLLAGRIAERSVAGMPSGDSATFQLSVFPRETGWIIEDALVGALSSKKATRVNAGGSYGAEFGIADLHVAYENIRRDGFFGSKIVDRCVRVVLHAKITEVRDGSVLLSQDMTEEQRDTVLVSGVERLESAALPATKGQLPGEGIFSTIAEPIVVLGTIAVAVILLFTVRSQ